MNDHSTQEVRFISLRELPLNWKWMIGVGVFMLIFGTLGLLASSILTLTSVLMFGGFIFAGGIIQLIHGFAAKEKEWSGKLQHFFIALLYIIAGLIIFWDPLATSLLLTILLASLFGTIGIIRIWYATRCKKQDWKWLLPAFTGLMDLVLAAIVIATLPESAVWLIGLLIAIEMLFNGWLLLLLGLRVRKMENNQF
jgi:uncharacterized membrane protein HdeD (DUF308 family)